MLCHIGIDLPLATLIVENNHTHCHPYLGPKTPNSTDLSPFAMSCSISSCSLRPTHPTSCHIQVRYVRARLPTCPSQAPSIHPHPILYNLESCRVRQLRPSITRPKRATAPPIRVLSRRKGCNVAQPAGLTPPSGLLLETVVGGCWANELAGQPGELAMGWLVGLLSDAWTGIPVCGRLGGLERRSFLSCGVGER